MRDRCYRFGAHALLAEISIAALAISQPALAQGTETAQAERSSTEIVVTASRRDTTAQDTPIAVAVTTGEALTNNNVASLQDLTRISPSVVVNNAGAAGNQFIIRGILSDIGSTTGLYLDEMPLIGGGALEGAGDGRPGLRLHDVARIEVLKGPQGTLFGSGSMAGTLRIITNKPKLDTVEGSATVSAATIDQGSSTWQGDGVVNLPVSSSLAFRGVFWGEKGGNYIDHRISPLAGGSPRLFKDVNDRTLWGGRLSALFEPAPDVSLLISGVHQEVKVGDSENWDLDYGRYTSLSPTVERYDDNYDAVSANLEYKASIGTFSAIGTYANQKSAKAEDSTPTGLGLAGAFGLQPFKTLYRTAQQFEVYTGELRFASALEGPLQFVVGAYYQHDKNKGLSSALRADDVTGQAACLTVEQCEALGRRQSGFSAPGVPASDFIYGVASNRTVKQWAAYGQFDLKIASNLTATAGIRYFDARIHDLNTQIQDIAGPPDFAVPVPVPSWAANGLITVPYVTMDARAKENSPSYNFSLLYEATPDFSLFGRVASGFRIGGTNNAESLAGQTGVIIPSSYGSDDLWSYELGVKAYAAGRRLYVDASIYQMDWSRQQLAAVDPSGAFDYVLNAGKTRIRGAELQVTYNSDIGLSLGGGITYTDAKLMRDLDPEVIAGGTIGYKGDRVPRVPRWTAAGQARYEVPLNSQLGFYVQGDVSYRSSSSYSFNDLNEFNPKLDSFVLLGANIGIATDRFDFRIFAQNLTNEVAIYGLDASPDGIRTYSADPRTIGMRVSAKF